MDRQSLGRSMEEEQAGSGGDRVQRIGTVIRRVRNRNKTIQHKCGCVVHNCDSEQQLASWIPYHTVFGFQIPLLIALLQVNNQGTNKYSFETHPANLWVFLPATFVYCVAFAADMKSNFYSTNYAKLSRFVAVISGSLSYVSLISIFLPPLPGRLIFIPWTLVSIVLSRGLILRICCGLYQMIMKTFFQVFGIWNRFRGSGLMEQPPLLV
ncbi:hypothetical protein Ddye_018103 [Dipteronia dyeriana]|uniref:Uncharacterized protein n=1 Tax=Dipteronia dyeriana TaxID=168575 RepID=A0AAD9UAS2_9ROSI|nr:hypothetical protein Ddye_018103 [Dipteronia dyeriana]